MALSMDEQRALAEIERRLAADDPGLAACLTAFRRPGPASVLRSPRARIIGSLFTVLLVALLSLMVYAMIPFRSHVPRPTSTSSTSTQDHASMAASSAGGKPPASSPAPASASGAPTGAMAASANAPARSASPSAGPGAGNSQTRSASGQTTGQVASTSPGP